MKFEIIIKSTSQHACVYHKQLTSHTVPSRSLNFGPISTPYNPIQPLTTPYNPIQFHNDGDSGLVNIFIPLVPIEEDGDGTQLWPGTHTFGPGMVWKAPDERAMRHMRSPAIDAGGLMLFECVT